MIKEIGAIKLGIIIAAKLASKGDVAMKSTCSRWSFFLVLAVPLIALSCGSITAPKPGLNIVASIGQQSPGSITFRIGVENTGSATEALEFRSSQFFDIEVRSRSGQLVWQFSHNKFFSAVLWGLELAPGESSVRDSAWDLTGDDEKRLPSGTYTAKIYITNSPRDEDLSSAIKLII
jgi:hypothetical protein